MSQPNYKEHSTRTQPPAPTTNSQNYTGLGYAQAVYNRLSVVAINTKYNTNAIASELQDIAKLFIAGVW